jgi:hypothetical protein
MKNESQCSLAVTTANDISDFMRRSTCHPHRNERIVTSYPTSAQWYKLHVVIAQKTSTRFSKQQSCQQG